jgi:hypothetical protein
VAGVIAALQARLATLETGLALLGAEAAVDARALLQREIAATRRQIERLTPKAPAVERNKRLGVYKPVRGKLIYPFYPVPLVPGRGVRGQERERVVEQIDALHAAMPHPALLVYLKAARERDSRYTFTMSAAQARQARGVVSKADKGDPYLKLLVDAGLIEQVLSGGVFGGTRVASTFRLLPWSPSMQTQAMAAFQAYRDGVRANDPTRGREGNPDRARSRQAP